MENEKKSVLKDALSDFNEIMEAANANAKKKLAEEFPEKFNKLLQEELKNNKKDKESDNKLDESKESNKDESALNNESVMKEQTEETKKEKVNESEAVEEQTVEEQAGEGKPFTENPKKEPNATVVDEDVTIKDTVGKGDPYEEKTEKGKKDEKDKKVNESEEVAPVAEEAEPVAEEAEAVEEQAGEGKPFTEKPKKEGSATAAEPQQANQSVVNETEEFDITQLKVENVEAAVENANEGDEFLTMEAIEEELSNMEALEERDTSVAHDNSPSYMEKGNKGVAFNKLVSLKNQIDEMIQSLGEGEEISETEEVAEQKKHGGKQNFKGREKGGPTNQMIDEDSVEEMHKGGDGDGSTSFGTDTQVDRLHNDGPTTQLIDEENPISDEEIDAAVGSAGTVAEEEVTEAMGMAHSSSKHKPGEELPGKGFATHRHKRIGSPKNESEEKKITSLIGENKKLTKKFNEDKKYKEGASKLLESYKSHLERYRTQLKEMAVFNTNLAHVNNLLVNEELALTQDDKIKIINEFKKVDNITESQDKYKTFLNEMKESKTTLSESIEEKVSTSVQPSSKQALDEVVEKTAYENDEHIKRMKSLIEYVENRGKKIIS